MDNNQIDLTWLWSTLGAVGSGLAGWLFGRKKQNVEVKSTELDNVEKAVAIWREMASDLRGQFQALQAEVLTLQKQVTKLEIENERLKANNEEFQAEIDDLRKQMKP
jgi:peptidoglycan hydrolase CwlO-like protein